MALSVAIIAGHQYWIAAELRANFDAGGLGDPDGVFSRIRLMAYLLEGLAFFIGLAGVIQATLKFMAAVHRRKQAPARKSILMPGRCS